MSLLVFFLVENTQLTTYLFVLLLIVYDVEVIMTNFIIGTFFKSFVSILNYTELTTHKCLSSDSQSFVL